MQPCSEVEVDYVVFPPFLRRQAYQSAGTEEPDQPLVTREGTRAKRLLVLVDSRVVLGAISKGRSSSRKMDFLLRKLGFW